MVSKQNKKKKVMNMTIGVQYFHARRWHLLTCFCEQHGLEMDISTASLINNYSLQKCSLHSSNFKNLEVEMNGRIHQMQRRRKKREANCNV